MEQLGTVKEAKDLINREANVFRRYEHSLDCSAKKQEVLRRMTGHLLSHARGIALLFEAGLTYQGMVLVRSFEELLVDIHYLWKDPAPETFLLYQRWAIKSFLRIQDVTKSNPELNPVFQKESVDIENQLHQNPNFDWKIRKDRDKQSCWSQLTVEDKKSLVSPDIRNALNQYRRVLHLPVHNDPVIFLDDWDSSEVHQRLMEVALYSVGFTCYKTIELWNEFETTGGLTADLAKLRTQFLRIFHHGDQVN
jgi:hypothetical protein